MPLKYLHTILQLLISLQQDINSMIILQGSIKLTTMERPGSILVMVFHTELSQGWSGKMRSKKICCMQERKQETIFHGTGASFGSPLILICQWFQYPILCKSTETLLLPQLDAHSGYSMSLRSSGSTRRILSICMNQRKPSSDHGVVHLTRQISNSKVLQLTRG